MNKFEEFGLNSAVLKAIGDMGFENPTPVQEQTIPILLEGQTDLVALAQTGTGKTAAFGLPLLQLLDFTKRTPQALILCPTRELCMQITRDINTFATHMNGVSITAVYGGASIMNQLQDIKRGVQIIVATPGRLIDIISRKRIDLSGIKYLVLDEADEMLNMGFKEDIDLILSETPSTKNTWLFSATMPNEIQKIAKTYMHEPKEVQIGNRNQGNDNIDHVYYTVNSGDRYAALKRVVDASPDIFGIVFCRTKIETQDISDSLIKDGYNADALHGDLSQAQRDHVMKRYRSRTLQLLVCTDVAARGIDVTDVTHVINYNLPDEIEYYTHRSGRTARAGKKGISIAIITTREVGKIRDIERKIKKTFTQGVLPTGIEVCEKQLINLVKNVHDVKVNEEAIAAYLPTVHDELKELDREEIIKRFISIEFNRFLDYYKNAPDLNSKGRSAGGSFPGDATKLFINIGSMDGFDPLTLKDYLREVTGFTKQEITYVASKNAYSFVEVAQAKVEEFIKIMSKQKNNGRQVRVEFRGDQQPNSRPPRRSYDDKPQRHYSDSNSGGGGGGSRPSEGGNRTFRKRSPMKAR